MSATLGSGTLGTGTLGSGSIAPALLTLSAAVATSVALDTRVTTKLSLEARPA